MSKFVTMMAACLFLAGAFVLAPVGRGATSLPGPDGPAPIYQGGLRAAYCLESGSDAWGPFGTRDMAETFAGGLRRRAVTLVWCPIR